MRVKVDFQLNHWFGIVENIIFRLVLNGFSNAKEIACALPLFSDSVLANATMNLVNHQILSANVEKGSLSLSDSLLAIIEMCLEKEYDINIPSELTEAMNNQGILLSGLVYSKSTEMILHELLPGINLDIYKSSIDFVIHRSEGNAHDK